MFSGSDQCLDRCCNGDVRISAGPVLKRGELMLRKHVGTNMENGVANCCLREAFESVCDEQVLNVVTE